MVNFKSVKEKFAKPNVIFEVVFSALFIFAVLGKVFYFQFFGTEVSRKPYFTAFNLNMLQSTLAILLIVFALVFFVFNAKRKIVLFIINVLISVLFIADVLYFKYYHTVISAPVLYQIGLVGSVGGSIASLFSIKDLIYIIDLPILAAGLFLSKRFGGLKIEIAKRAVASAIMIAVAGAGSVFAYQKADHSTYDNNTIVKNLGIGYFHLFDAKRFVKENVLVDKSLSGEEQKEIEAFFAAKEDEGTKYEGVAKGKNLVVIQLEAIQSFLMHKEINGQEIMPNLNKLAKESFYFDRYHQQVSGGNTSDAEFLSNTSLYPVSEGAVYFRYATNEYYSMPKQLKKQGYNTYVFHGYNPSFWNRTEMYKAVGFDRFTSIKDFVIDEYKGWGGWALSDATFFRQSLDIIDSSKPFYGFFITLSSHHPYDVYKDDPFNSAPFEGTSLGNYMKAANYVDRAVGNFIEDLKKRGLYENTVIAIYGDHQAMTQKDAAEVTKFLQVDSSEATWEKIHKGIPLIIRCPGVDKGKVIHTAGGQIDLWPTLANLMGMDVPYGLGKDLLNTEEGYALFRTGSLVTDKYFYLSSQLKAYDINTGEPIPKEQYEEELKMRQEELRISDMMIKKDAFKKIPKK